jgi:hypothetical protein
MYAGFTGMALLDLNRGFELAVAAEIRPSKQDGQEAVRR